MTVTSCEFAKVTREFRGKSRELLDTVIPALHSSSCSFLPLFFFLSFPWLSHSPIMFIFFLHQCSIFVCHDLSPLFRLILLLVPLLFPLLASSPCVTIPSLISELPRAVIDLRVQRFASSVMFCNAAPQNARLSVYFRFRGPGLFLTTEWSATFQKNKIIINKK